MVLVNKRAAMIVPDKKVKSELFPCLLQLVKDEAMMKELGNNASELKNINADETIVAEIIKQINNKA
jgi:UDP-N-acetylglucosamine:LPS N-acetylglucosamine transferase